MPAAAEPRAFWSEEEVGLLREAYEAPTSRALDLAALAHRLGRTKVAVCIKARKLGLTDADRPVLLPEEKKLRVPKFATDAERRAHVSEVRKRHIAEHGHPRGMLGKKHSPEALQRISQASIASNAARSQEEKTQLALKALQTRVANGVGFTARITATWKAGWRVIGGVRKFYRSRWEANYARYLQWLKERGEILDWKHEPFTFWFEGVKRGTVSYLPDFWVKEKSGKEAYHEVKGWFDDRSKTKLARMARYYPDVRLLVIDGDQYRAIARQISPFIPDWEHGRRGE